MREDGDSGETRMRGRMREKEKGDERDKDTHTRTHAMGQGRTLFRVVVWNWMGENEVATMFVITGCSGVRVMFVGVVVYFMCCTRRKEKECLV